MRTLAFVLISFIIGILTGFSFFRIFTISAEEYEDCKVRYEIIHTKTVHVLSDEDIICNTIINKVKQRRINYVQ